MSYIASSLFHAKVRERLEQAGYSFHEGVDAGRPDLGDNAKWFEWSAPGMCEAESGPTFGTWVEAESSAVDHFFDNAKIPMDDKG